MRFPNDSPIPGFTRGGNDAAKYIAFGVVALLVLIVLSKLVIVVPAGTRVVIFNSFSGVEQRVLGEGMNILLPFVQSPVFYDVRTQTYTMATSHDEGDRFVDSPVMALTADGQTVKMDMSIRFHVIPEDAWQLHQQVGPSFVEKIIRPEARSIVREVVSGYTVTQVYSGKRTVIQTKIQEQMTKALGKYHLALDELLIRNVSFSEAFATAIEQKQVALQEAERMRYVLQKEESEKERKIIEASGEAEAIRLRAQALRQNPQLIQYEFVQKLSPEVKAIITDQKTIMNFGEIFSKN
jgi:prohibitin 2